MNRHAVTEELIALRMGTLGGEESRVLLNHIAGCAMCQRSAQEVLDVKEAWRSVGLRPALGRGGRPEAHTTRWLITAAILAAVAVTAVLLQRAPAPPVVVTATAAPSPAPAPPPVVPAIVRETLAAGRIDPPAILLALQPTPDEFRALGGDARVPDMRPFGEVVESDRPLFRWPRTKGATYTVLVGERGRIVAQSPSLRDNSWRCGIVLPRGRTYRWQVEVKKGDETSMMPMPPAPSARFHVLDAQSKAEIDAAPKDDRLLLGILYAKAGLRDEALELLTDKSLRESVERWPTPRRSP